MTGLRGCTLNFLSAVLSQVARVHDVYKKTTTRRAPIIGVRGRDGMSKVGGLGVHEDLKYTFVLNIT